MIRVLKFLSLVQLKHFRIQCMKRNQGYSAFISILTAHESMYFTFIKVLFQQSLLIGYIYQIKTLNVMVKVRFKDVTVYL